MSAPLSSFEQNQIQAVDSQLEQYIHQCEQGTENPAQLDQIHNTLMALATNPRIPRAVQQSLQVALNQLKESPHTSLANVQAAKAQVDRLLTESSEE